MEENGRLAELQAETGRRWGERAAGTSLQGGNEQKLPSRRKGWLGPQQVAIGSGKKQYS